MKNVILSLATLLSLNVMAREVTPMHVVEKASYQVNGLVSKSMIDSSYLTDINSLTITKEVSGFKVLMQSPSAVDGTTNTLEIPFDANGKAGVAVAQFNSKFPEGPVFTVTNAATLLDLGAEAIVDHLSDTPDHILVARTAESLLLQKEASGVVMMIHLNDGRVYSIHMDFNGKVLSQGF